jgi:hypothetical protein
LNYTKEQIFHFTCETCELWWSIGVENIIMDKKIWICPWCGRKHFPPHFILIDGVAHIPPSAPWQEPGDPFIP